ncbi:MAG TPA: hypothetical protein VMV69_07675 [Pirellulales bacterium]|nr:hypothetical protein [Pirellulales bacterium]
MTLIKDLISIPEHVRKGDFVLKLVEDIGRPHVVLDNYVVTPELARCYDLALMLIRSAVQGRTSKAAYLHGSFGSGKSHLMAVLHEILQGNPDARGIAELASVIQKHNEWLAGKKFLLVPYHMLGAHDTESGILGGYVEFMRRAHPEAPVAPVYMSAAIISQAAAERANYGDGPFFKRLNAGQGGGQAGGGDGWGELDAAWDAASFEAAAAAPPDSELHLRLVSTLLKTVATAQVEVISQRGGNFVRFDKGLEIINQHAAQLGYDALIFFLDELILWLSQNSADLGFIKREAAKLTSLVESQSADRPIPLVSFVARQRDLRKLVGDHVPGAEKLSFSDSLDFQQGRFDTITLEDRNLPAIAERRVLKPNSQAAKDELDAAFAETARMKDNVMNILLTQEGDRPMFRKVYPFSPALVQTLIAVSSVLQRERTALKVMIQLLVDQRETLKVGELIPVGDLFDVVAHGDEAFSAEMAIHFDNAKRLYHQKLLPVLERRHGIRREDVEQLDYSDPKRASFRNDDRLVKTLLLSALVPEVESLRGLNAEKLAALNHGTIKVPIPGTEGKEVLRRIKTWAAGVGEIRIGEEANPTITVQLSGVDTESILAQAGGEDNHGNRVRRVKQMLYEQLGIVGEGELEQYHEFLWRNTKRHCVVLFKNVRELPDSSLENTGADWKLVIDFPVDEQGHGPRDDLSKLQSFASTHPEGAKTLCWVPSFFSPDSQRDLGTLVILEHILTGERFGQYANHLSPQDRQTAKSLLENQRSVLNQRVRNHLDAAYGLDAMTPGSLDTTRDLELGEHYVSLEPGFAPQPPVAADLGGAVRHLLSQALAHEFPAAPHFDAEIKLGVLKKVQELVMPATQASEDRLAIEKTQRQLLRQVANPLNLGEMGADATYFVLGQHWKTHFGRKAEAGSQVTVAQLRRWIDEPKPMGLPKEAQNLIILFYAAQTNRTLFRHGGPYDGATLQNIPDDCELRTVDLPTSADWELATRRAASIFGLTPPRLLSAANAGSVSKELKTKAGEARGGCQGYHQRLSERFVELGMRPEGADRLKTAIASQTLVDRLHTAEAGAIIRLLAAADIATSEAAMAECVSKAVELDSNLNTANWDLFEAIGRLSDERQAVAQQILAELRAALAGDEHVAQLASALKAAQAKAVRLLTRPDDKTPPKPPLVPPVKPPVVTGKKVVEQGTREGLSLQAAKEMLADLTDQAQPGRMVRINLSWSIEEGGDK